MDRRALHSRRVVTLQGTREATVLWEGGRITEVADGCLRREGWAFETAGDLVVLPGLIDPHVHINAPGRTEWEGFESATRAAAAGGVTTLLDMPLNSVPVTTSPGALAAKRSEAEGKLQVHCGFHGGLVPDNAGDLEPLLGSGVFGIKAFLTPSGIEEFPHVGEADIRRALPAMLRHDALLMAHCELEAPGTTQWLEREPRSHDAWLASRPNEWEDRAVGLVADLALQSGVRAHIVHVSSASALGVIAEARSRGARLTAETCPHYLVFCSEEIGEGEVQYKCAPPIRDRANNEHLWEALRTGTLDWVASDHSPAPPEFKQAASGDFRKAWGGIAGLQFGLRAFWTAARERGFSFEEVARLFSASPAARFGLHRKGALEAGRDADIVVWDPDARSAVRAGDVLHRHPLTPYEGRNWYGAVRRTVVGGRDAFAHDRVFGPPHGERLDSRGL